MIPVILGPTGIGKTDVSIELAKKINGEIVSCDSRQIYKFMDISTAKPTKELQKEIRHHLIDIVEPDTEYSAVLWAKDCEKAVSDIRERGKIPIICGGTFFYIYALKNGLSLSAKRDIDLRNDLEIFGETHGYEKLHERLAKLNAERAGQIKLGDKHRILRALEIEMSEKNEFEKSKIGSELKYFVLSCSREKLYERVNTRVDKMQSSGLFKEYEEIAKKYPDPKTPGRNCVGLREFDLFVQGEESFEQCIDKIKQHSRNFAKRQLTWLRNKEADKRLIDVEKFDYNVKSIASNLEQLLFSAAEI